MGRRAGVTPGRQGAAFARFFGAVFAFEALSCTAARIKALNAVASMSSPSRMSIARLTLPSRLALKSLAGSGNEAPFAKVSFTTDLYDSPVQMMPSCDHTGVPIHFNSSTTCGSASWISARIRAKVFPRQSASPAILSSINFLSLDMRVHPEVTRPAADDAPAAEEPLALEAAALEHLDRPAVRSEHGGLHAKQLDMGMRPFHHDFAHVAGDALAPPRRSQVVREFGRAVLGRHGMKAYRADELVGRSIRDREPQPRRGLVGQCRVVLELRGRLDVPAGVL